MRVSFGHLRGVTRAAGLALVLSTLAASVPAVLHAQVRRDTTRAPAAAAAPRSEQRTPEAMQHTDMQQMDMMAPMMGHMTQAMMQGMLAVLARPETAERMATFTRNYHDALVAKGFSREEAMRIVMAHGIPSLRMGQ